jgi:hypothetical protein
MKAIGQLLTLCCILNACTLIGYDERRTDAGRDAGWDAGLDSGRDGALPDAGGKTEDATVFEGGNDNDAADAGPEMDSGIPDAAVDSGPTQDGATRDAGPDAGRTGDASVLDAGRTDAQQDDSGF